YLFFFQAEDGIRDRTVTGVQTCALPILREAVVAGEPNSITGQIVRAQIRLVTGESSAEFRRRMHEFCRNKLAKFKIPAKVVLVRSEERRVGKECRYRCARYH